MCHGSGFAIACFSLQPIGDLLGTPLLPQLAFDQPFAAHCPLNETTRLKAMTLSLLMRGLANRFATRAAECLPFVYPGKFWIGLVDYK